jgi:hypothetical protein
VYHLWPILVLRVYTVSRVFLLFFDITHLIYAGQYFLNSWMN